MFCHVGGRVGWVGCLGLKLTLHMLSGSRFFTRYCCLGYRGSRGREACRERREFLFMCPFQSCVCEKV